ncbi:hypothetical protein AB0Q95_35510 [Streptomyces sp. NPDC059900]|uniref:DUF7848 domain-containing protein n=1 Tax=Streptomyces sp. NPDC059900 TaxID=3155816 RepID=UPI00343F483D
MPLEWTLAAMPGSVVRHVGKCLGCSDHSVDSADPDAAQLWCLRHAGLTGHRGFELSAFQFFSAEITDPAAVEGRTST